MRGEDIGAAAAEHVEGGMVDAATISVDGPVVLDAAGDWVGLVHVLGSGSGTEICESKERPNEFWG